MIVGYLEGNDEHRARHLGARSTLIAQLAIDACQLAGLRLLPHQAAVAWAADHVPSFSKLELAQRKGNDFNRAIPAARKIQNHYLIVNVVRETIVIHCVRFDTHLLMLRLTHLHTLSHGNIGTTASSMKKGAPRSC